MAEFNFGALLMEREAGLLKWLLAPQQTARRSRVLALVKAGDGRAAEAAADWRSLASDASARWQDKHNLGAAHLAAGDFDAAAKWLRRARSEGGRDPKTVYALALTLWLQGQAQEAAGLARQEPGYKRLRLLAAALEAGIRPGRSLEEAAGQLAALAQARHERLRIAYMPVHTGITGGAKVLFEHANRLQAAGHQVEVFSHDEAPTWFELRTPFHRVPFYQLVSEELDGFDLVVGSFWTQLHDLFWLQDSTPVYFAQGDQFIWEPESLSEDVRTLVEQSHRHAAMPVMTVSDAMAERIRALYGRAAAVVPNGVDLRAYQPRSRQAGRPLEVMVMGRESLAFEGVPEAMEAVARVRQRGIDCNVVWVTPEAPVTQSPQCTVYRAPEQAVLADLYAIADVFVSSSHYESFSLPPLEAMAAGTPVIAYDNQGIRTYAMDGQNCLLVPPGDVEGLSLAIERLAQDPDLQQCLVVNGLATAAAFDWRPVMDQVERQLLRFWVGDVYARTQERPPAQKVSLCMIARDEAEQIGACIESARALVDDIVVVDTGSVDNTKEVASRAGARVFEVPWQNDFAQARNASLEHARGDWILVLDADERLQVTDPQAIQKAIRANPSADCLFVNIVSVTNEFDSSNAVSEDNPRLFRNRPAYRYEGAIHEQILLPIQRAGGRAARAVLPVLHYGYLPSVREAKQKTRRNLELLRRQVEAGENGSFLHFNLGNEYLAVGDFARAREEFQQSLALATEQDRLSPYFYRLARSLVRVEMGLGDWERALVVVRQMVEAYPEYTDLWYHMGLILAEKGLLDDATAAFDRCLQLGDTHERYSSMAGTGSWLALYQKGRLRERQDRLDEAIDLYEAALRQQPQYLEAAVRLAFILAFPSLPARLAERAEAALRASTAAAELTAQAHYKAGRYRRAGKAAEAAPLNGGVALARAAYHLSLGDTRQAEAVLTVTPLDVAQRGEAALWRTLAAWLDGRWHDAALAAAQVGDVAMAQALGAIGAALQGTEPQRADGAGTPSLDAVLAVLERLVNLEQYDFFERVLGVLPATGVQGWRAAVGKMLHRRGFTDVAADLLWAEGVEALDEEGLTMLAQTALARGLREEANALLERVVYLRRVEPRR